MDGRQRHLRSAVTPGSRQARGEGDAVSPAPWILLAGGYAVAALAVARFLPAVVWALPGCPFRALSGLPCPTCGVSRAMLALARVDLGEALAHHPLATLAVVLTILAAPWAAAHSLAPARFPLPRLNATGTTRVLRAGLVALLANWAYLLAG